jgi:hypothetical protein
MKGGLFVAKGEIVVIFFIALVLGFISLRLILPFFIVLIKVVLLGIVSVVQKFLEIFLG